jgi:hypothetical protein
MIAKDFFEKDKDELANAIRSLRASIETSVLPDLEQIDEFFKESANKDYTDFLVDYKLKYGIIIEHYRERNKVIAINIIKTAAILYIITFILGVIGVIVYFAS